MAYEEGREHEGATPGWEREIARRRDALFERIRAACAACGRDVSEIRVVAVTKAHGSEVVRAAARLGLFRIGENRVQEASVKRNEVGELNLYWEGIGPVQSNKASLAAATFDRIQSVDRIKIVQRLDRHACELAKRLPILLQVNTGDDPNKHGVAECEAEALLESALSASSLRVEGLMTIAPLTDDSQAAARAFAALRALRDRLADRCGVQLGELSMGMSGDLEDAIREGSTCVRVGSALFGERQGGISRPASNVPL